MNNQLQEAIFLSRPFGNRNCFIYLSLQKAVVASKMYKGKESFTNTCVKKN